jgi:hypothetical protein
VVLKPQSVGAKSGALAVQVATPAVNQSLAKSGTGETSIKLSSALLSFGLVTRGSAETITVSVSNPANNPLLSGMGLSFSGSANFSHSTSDPGSCGVTLASTSTVTTCTINVQYAPVSGEAKATNDLGTLTLTGTLEAIAQSVTVNLKRHSELRAKVGEQLHRRRLLNL